MATLWLSATCRVCLASDREMYRLANTALEETYERVTSSTLVVEGRPCCVCGVCLSALRRCRQFINTARKANNTLDRWIRNQPNTDMLKLTGYPLFSFTRSTTEHFEITGQQSSILKSGVKQERDLAENENNQMLHQQNDSNSDDEDNILTEEIKSEDTSDDDKGNIECHDTQVLSYPECINKYDEMIDIENNTQTSDDVKFDISEMSDDVGDGTAPGASNVGRNQEVSDEDIPLKIFRSRMRVKLNKDTERNENNELIHEQNKRTSDYKGDIPMKEKKYNDMYIDDIHEKQTLDDVEILEKLNKAGGETAANTSHNGSNQPSSDDDIPLQRVRTRKRALSEIAERGPAVKKRRSITSSQRRGNTGPAAALHNEGDTFSCLYCNYNTTKKYHLKAHSKMHSTEKPYSCDNCDFKSNHKTSLKLHLLTHTGEKPFACDKCDYTFRQKGHLNRHLMTHTGEKPFACDKCDFKCIQKVDLQRHLIRHTGKIPLTRKRSLAKVKQFACDKCDYRSSNKYDLNRHTLTHTGEKPFTCDICDYKCIRQISLKQHLVSHTGIKPFACDKCNYKCIRKSYLTSHIMKHCQTDENEKPFACDKCNYKCIRKSSLTSHLMKHCQTDINEKTVCVR